MKTKTYEIVDCVEKLQEAIAKTRKAQAKFATYTQEQVDKIFFFKNFRAIAIIYDFYSPSR